jgi:hypothetical protein
MEMCLPMLGSAMSQVVHAQDLIRIAALISGHISLVPAGVGRLPRFLCVSAKITTLSVINSGKLLGRDIRMTWSVASMTNWSRYWWMPCGNASAAVMWKAGKWC